MSLGGCISDIVGLFYEHGRVYTELLLVYFIYFFVLFVCWALNGLKFWRLKGMGNDDRCIICKRLSMDIGGDEFGMSLRCFVLDHGLCSSIVSGFMGTVDL